MGTVFVYLAIPAEILTYYEIREKINFLLVGSRRPTGGLWIFDRELWIDNGAVSLPFVNHIWGNFRNVGIGYTYAKIENGLREAGFTWRKRR